jgi:hypothetical protein
MHGAKDRPPGSRLVEWLLGESHPERPAGVDPLFGWRLWRVRDGTLLSWGVRHEWQPGVNQASCLGSRHCESSPGESCSCGFWALHSPTRCIRYARDTITDRSSVVGLVRAWGQVALHGTEGFRAEYATPVCLFSDWLWDVPEPAEHGRPLGWWHRVQRSLTLTDVPLAPAGDRESFLHRTADTYAVPLLSFDDALGSGFLTEQGVGTRALNELRSHAAGWGAHKGWRGAA